MAKAIDEFDALRTVVETLDSFDSPKQELILRLARERLGIPTGPPAPAPLERTQQIGTPQATQQTGANVASGVDGKSFINAKQPNNDIQFATTVAYYHQFEAPEGQRKDEID